MTGEQFTGDDAAAAMKGTGRSDSSGGLDNGKLGQNNALVAEFGRTKVFKFLKWHIPLHFEEGGILYMLVAKDLNYDVSDEGHMETFQYMWRQKYRITLKSSLTYRRSTVSKKVREKLKGIVLLSICGCHSLLLFVLAYR